MKSKSRTEYSTINMTVALVSRMIAILMGFVTRVIFTRTLSESYVGINGLFTDILNVLSMTELGAGTAITYALYRPIAEKDTKRQQALMHMFRNFYRVTALCVAVLGVSLIPFMDVIMKNQPDVDHLIFIYLLYLANSVFSYLLVYKRTMIEAHQMNYLVLLYQTGFLVLQDIIQIIILLTTGNFIAYLLIYIAGTLLSNICISRKANRLFPYINEKKREELPQEERRAIFRNIRAMLMHKLGNVVVNNTDNLLISAFVGVISVGVYSNYFLLIGSVRQILDQVFQGITASVGNLGATEEKKHVKRVFLTAFFVGQWLYGVAAICLYELLNPFVELSFGERYLFSEQIVLILCINFFINGTRKAVLTFRDSLGLFWFDRYKAIIEALLNFGISIVLVRNFGTIGVFMGTFISTMLTSVWVEPYVLYHCHLEMSSVTFFLRYAWNVILMGAIWAVTHLLCRTFEGGLFLTLAMRLLICAVVPNLLLFLFYGRTAEFQTIKRMIRRQLNGASAK